MLLADGPKIGAEIGPAKGIHATGHESGHSRLSALAPLGVSVYPQPTFPQFFFRTAQSLVVGGGTG
jgi:hypothetical protein